MSLLSSKERCLRAIELEEPDRIPLVLRVRPEPYGKLKEALGISRLQGEEEYVKVCEALGVDVLGTGIGLKGGYEVAGAEVKEEGFVVGRDGCFEVQRNIFGYETIWAPDHTYTYTFRYHPLQHIDLKDYRWPEVRGEDVSNVERFCRRYEDWCIYGGISHMFEVAWKLTGFEEFMVAMYTKPGLVNEILDRLNEIRTEQGVLLAEAGVDVVCDGDDVGAQHSMMVSPKLWRRYLKPRYESMVRRVKRRGVYIFFHSDGWIEPIIPDLIDIGVDILNPIQPECMDPAKLKMEYGDRICFDGTIGVQSTLPFETPSEVEKVVKERIRTLGPTGLILGPTHVIQPDVPIENILTLYRSAKNYGQLSKLKQGIKL